MHLEENMKSGPEAIFTTCPMQGCKIIVPESFFKELLSPKMFERYKYYFKKSFIDKQKHCKWCPGPGCTYGCEFHSDKQIDVECECGYDWCFFCLKKAHKPISCDLLDKWYERIQGSEDDTTLWIKLNTKTCPKCKVQIQKN